MALIRPGAVRVIFMCSHRLHRHGGTAAGWCLVCKAKWCTIRPYDCELRH